MLQKVKIKSTNKIETVSIIKMINNGYRWLLSQKNQSLSCCLTLSCIEQCFTRSPFTIKSEALKYLRKWIWTTETANGILQTCKAMLWSTGVINNRRAQISIIYKIFMWILYGTSTKWSCVLTSSKTTIIQANELYRSMEIIHSTALKSKSDATGGQGKVPSEFLISSCDLKQAAYIAWIVLGW